MTAMSEALGWVFGIMGMLCFGAAVYFDELRALYRGIVSGRRDSRQKHHPR